MENVQRIATLARAFILPPSSFILSSARAFILHPSSFILSLALAFLLPPSSFILCAELQLRSECDCSTGLVRLADVAEIHASDPAEAKSLGEIELFPAPAAGSKAFVRAREIQDLLALRGINLSRHRLSGASQIEVRHGGGAREAGVRLTASIARRATDRVSEAIVNHLRRQSPEGEGWQVELKLTDDQLRCVAASREDLTAEAAKHPGPGGNSTSSTCHRPAADARSPSRRRSTPPRWSLWPRAACSPAKSCKKPTSSSRWSSRAWSMRLSTVWRM